MLFPIFTVAALATACSANGGDRQSQPTNQPQGSPSENSTSSRGVSPRVLTIDLGTRFIPMARVQGELRLQAGCLLVDSVVSYWPEGTLFEEKEGAIKLPDGMVARVGEPLDGAGAYFSITDSPQHPDLRLVSGLRACLTRTGSTEAVFVGGLD